MGWRLHADLDVCIGAGSCVLIAPAVFDQDDESGLVELLSVSPNADRIDDVKSAVDQCPSGALSLVASEGTTE